MIVFDDCDIIYVCVESNNKDELEKWVVFKIFWELFLCEEV